MDKLFEVLIQAIIAIAAGIVALFVAEKIYEAVVRIKHLNKQKAQSLATSELVKAHLSNAIKAAVETVSPHTQSVKVAYTDAKGKKVGQVTLRYETSDNDLRVGDILAVRA